MSSIREAPSLRSLLDRALDAILAIDEDETVLYANLAAGALVERTSADCIGRPLAEFLPDAAPAHPDCWLRGRVERDAGPEIADRVREAAVRSASGEIVPVDVKVFEIEPAGGRRRFGAIVRDARERKRAEDANRELIAKLDRLANIDELTGLPNRRAFHGALAKALSAAHRHRRDTCVAIADLDRFKAINDTHGHAVGDEVLRKTARTIELALRAEDLIGRLGGEEFGVVLPETGRAAARLGLNRLRRSIADSPVRLPDGTELAVTISIGFCLADPTQDGTAAIERADTALYRAKEAGRNRVTE